MDRNAVPRGFQIAYSFVKWRRFLWLAVPLLLAPSLLAHLVLWRFEDHLHLEVNRRPWFSFVPGTIDLSRSELIWKDHFRVRPGSLKVHYPILGILTGEFPISVEGKELLVTFESHFAQLFGDKELRFRQVSAQVNLSASRGFEIKSLDADSATIEFHLHPGSSA